MKQHYILITMVTGQQFSLIYESKILAIEEFEEMLEIFNKSKGDFVHIGSEQETAVNVAHVATIELKAMQ